MNVPNLPAPPGPVTIPLSTEVRQAYQHLYDAMQAAIETTRDAAVLEALNMRQADVDDVLTKDDMYRLHANTALFKALYQQIKDTNKGLKQLQEQISSIASGFAEAGEVFSAVNSVLSLVPLS